MGCKLAHGQTRGLVGQQYVSDGSTLRRHSSPSHESSFPHFAMYLPQAQSDLKGPSLVSHPKDVSVKLPSSPQSQPPSTHSGSPPSALTLACSDAAPKQLAASETHVTTSSVTTEVNEKSCKSDGLVTSPGGPREAQSKRSEGLSGMMTIPGGSMSKFQGALLADPGLKVRVPSSKPGVVERIVPLNGGHVYGSPTNKAMPENSSESSSSICQASDDSGSCTSEDAGGDMEAQSAYRGPLTGMAALDESLPIKRPGLSKFFGGKSRSFASLADVSSVSDLAKPNNPYAYIRRRKMGFNCPLDRHRSYPPPTRSSGASIAKKLPTSGSRNSLAVAVILEGLTDDQQEQLEQPAPAPSTIRTAETRAFPSRSFSLTDLHRDGGSPPPLRRAFVRS